MARSHSHEITCACEPAQTDRLSQKIFGFILGKWSYPPLCLLSHALKPETECCYPSTRPTIPPHDRPANHNFPNRRPRVTNSILFLTTVACSLGDYPVPGTLITNMNPPYWPLRIPLTYPITTSFPYITIGSTLFPTSAFEPPIFHHLVNQTKIFPPYFVLFCSTSFLARGVCTTNKINQIIFYSAQMLLHN